MGKEGGAYSPKVGPPLATPGKYSMSFGGGSAAKKEEEGQSAYASSLSAKPFKGMY